MSNSRKMKRSVKRNVGAVSVAALSTVTVAGGLMAMPGTAFAAVPTTAKDAVSGAPTVYPGISGQAAGNVTLTISNTFSAGDQIIVPIVDAAAAPAYSAAAPTGQTGTVAQSVAYSALPTVTVANSTASPNAADVAPTLTETLTTNTNDSTANKNAGTKDELVINIGNTANATAPGDTYTVTVSGVKYDIGAQATAPGSVYVEPVYLANSGAGAGAYAFTAAGVPAVPPATSTALANATVANYQVTQTPTGVPQFSPKTAIGDMTLKEVNPGTFPSGAAVVYTVTPSAGALTGTATISATGFKVAPVTGGVCGTSGASATASPTAAGTYQFCVTSGTSAATGPGSLVISGMSFNATGVGPGAVTVTVSNSSTPATFAAPQPAITVVQAQNVSGFTADDTAAQAAATAAQIGGAGNVHAVVLASDAEYQDALSASYLIHSVLPAQNINGSSVVGGSTLNPLLLNPYDTSDEAGTAAAQEIRKLAVGTVYVVGGTAAISQDVVNQLQKIQVGANANGQPVYLQVVRIAGVTAEETASDVAQYPSNGAGTLPATPAAYGLYNSGASESTSGPTGAAPYATAIVADGDEFQDALAASPLASAYRLPVLLNPGGQGLDPNVSAALTNLHVQQVIVVGGSAAVSDTAVTGIQNMGIPVLRIAGTTFDATANELAQFEVNWYNGKTGVSAAVEGLHTPATNSGNPNLVPAPSLTVGTSRGDAYQDALSSAQVLGTWNGSMAAAVVDPLLLNSGTNQMSAGTGDFLTKHGTPPTATFKVYNAAGAGTAEQVLGDIVFGGSLAQTPSLIQAELNDIALG